MLEVYRIKIGRAGGVSVMRPDGKVLMHESECDGQCLEDFEQEFPSDQDAMMGAIYREIELRKAGQLEPPPRSE